MESIGAVRVDLLTNSWRFDCLTTRSLALFAENAQAQYLRENAMTPSTVVLRATRLEESGEDPRGVAVPRNCHAGSRQLIGTERHRAAAGSSFAA